jgi:glycerol-3-phosphate dehydrogenase
VAHLTTEVLVIGGGTTGAGVAWDAALRGFDVILVERQDLGTGTSGRFHGLLHSGGRYAVKDPSAAEECIEENHILRHVAAATIEDTGGLFVCAPEDDPAYGDRFLDGCRKTGIPVEELQPAEALRREPRLNPGITRAFDVPDASVDSWMLLAALARGAERHGARVLTYHEVTALHRSEDAVTGATVRNQRTGEEVRIEAGFTINASGPWAAEITAMAGIEGVNVVPGKGIMIAMAHRLVHSVVNRCTLPADGDIIVPIHTVSVIGTTDIHVPDPDELEVTQAEVDQMLAAGDVLVPGFSRARALRVWAGARPLFKDTKGPAQGTGGAHDEASDRDITRSHALLDHEVRDGVKGLVTITSGKLTTFRRMAKDTVDAMCRQLGESRPCTTDIEVLPGSEGSEGYALGSRLASKEEHFADAQIVCECEMVSRRRFEEELRRSGTHDLDDVRRALRLGMGPCQGGFCMYRAAGIMQDVEAISSEEAAASLRGFLQERWKGVWPILYGDQLRQARLDDWIFQGLMDVEHMPDGVRAAVPA